MNEPVEEVGKSEIGYDEIFFKFLKGLEKSVRFSLWEEFDKWLLEFSAEVLNPLWVIKSLRKRLDRKEDIINTVINRYLTCFLSSEVENAKIKLTIFAGAVYEEWINFKRDSFDVMNVSHRVQLNFRTILAECEDLAV